MTNFCSPRQLPTGFARLRKKCPMKPRATPLIVLLAAWTMTTAGLQSQTVPDITLATPFSPGGFNNIGSATATRFFDTRGGVLTIEVDPATPQVIDVMNSYTANSNSNLPINFSFLNADSGIPTTFFGQKWNFLNGGPLAQFQSGHFDFSLSITGAPNILPVLDMGSDVYSKSVRFWMITQTNILNGKYYPNGVPVPVQSASAVQSPTPKPGANVPKDPSTGKVYTSNINPDKPLNTNVYRASGLSDHIANNDLTSNKDFNNVLSIVALLPDAAQTESSFHQVIAEPYASMLSVALESMDRFRQAALAGAGTGKVPRQRILKTPSPDAKKSVIEEFEVTPWSVFTDISNTQANLDGTNSGLSDFNYSILQSILGVEYAVSPSLTTGAVFGYGRSTLYNFEFADVDLTSDNFSAALFGTYRPGRFSFTGLLGYTCFSYQSTRQIQFGTPQAGYVDRTANADWVAHGLTGAIEATYTWSLGPVNIIPETMLATAWQFQPGFTESGADSLDLAVDSTNVGSLIFGLGIVIEAPIKITKSLVLTPKIRAAWEHDFLGDDTQDHEVDASFANVPEPGSLTVLGQNRGSDELSLSGALELAVNDRWTFFGGFEWADWSNGTEATYGGGIRYSW